MRIIIAKSIILTGILLQSLQAEESFFNFDKLSSTIGKSVNGLLNGSTDTNASAVKKEIPKKKVAIVIDPKRSPDGLFQERVLSEFEKMLQTGQIKSYLSDTDTFLGSQYKIVHFDLLAGDLNEQKKIAEQLKKGLQSNKDSSISANPDLFLAHNIFFGDKTKYYMKNPYIGCLNEDRLKNSLKNFQIVDVAENPDYTIKVEIDTCLTASEFETKYAEYRGIPLEKKYLKRDDNSTMSGDLVRGGVQAAATTDTIRGDKVGMAMAGVGLAIGAVDWLLKPSEYDVVRLKTTFEGKNKKSFTYYPTSYSNSSHDWGRAVGLLASNRPIDSLGNAFKLWEQNDTVSLSKISVLETEKETLKAFATARDEEAKKKESK